MKNLHRMSCVVALAFTYPIFAGSTQEPAGFGNLASAQPAAAKSKPDQEPGTDKVAPPSLKYRCEIPRGLVVEIDLLQKTGREKTFNQHQLYQNYHALGWYGLVKYFGMTGRLDYQSGVICNWKCQFDALQIGVSEASIAIRQLRLVLGEERTRQVVAKFVTQNKKTLDKMFPESPELTR